MTLQLTKHTELDCSLPWTQETGRERRQTKAERARARVKRAKCMCLKTALSVTPVEKPVKRLFHLNRVYNNPPDRITNQNMDLQSTRTLWDWPGAFLNGYAPSWVLQIQS